jgi:hypothetical protein
MSSLVLHRNINYSAVLLNGTAKILPITTQFPNLRLAIYLHNTHLKNN